MKRATDGDTPSGAGSPDSRGRLLRETSEAEGATWAREYLETVEKSGRAIEGGWPGTLPEARARVLRSLPSALSARGFSPLNAREVAVASAMLSAAARRSWQPKTKRRSP